MLHTMDASHTATSTAYSNRPNKCVVKGVCPKLAECCTSLGILLHTVDASHTETSTAYSNRPSKCVVKGVCPKLAECCTSLGILLHTVDASHTATSTALSSKPSIWRTECVLSNGMWYISGHNTVHNGCQPYWSIQCLPGNPDTFKVWSSAA